MSLTLYDKAIVNKIKKWINDPNVTITDDTETRRVFMYESDVNNDKPISLPIVAIRRLSPITIINTTRTPMSYNGYKVEKTEDKSMELNAIPISIDYQLDIYTRHLEEASEYIREFIFNFVNFPSIEIEVPYNDSHLIQEATINLNPNIEDNSSVPERIIAGQFSRFTLSFNIPNAYLYNVKVRDNYKVNVTTEVKYDIKEKTN